MLHSQQLQFFLQGARTARLTDRAVCTIAGLAVGISLLSLFEGSRERLNRLRALSEKQDMQLQRQLRELRSCSMPLDLAETSTLIHKLFWKDCQTDIREAYCFPSDQPLGSGAYGVVWLAKHRRTGIKRAVKRIDKRWLRPGEIEAWKKMDHPHVCRLVEYFESPHYLWLVTELCHGEELCERIISEQRGLPETEVAKFMEQMLRATLHCHQRGMLHRDLKPENFLFTGADCEDLKLIDFGFAVQDGTWSAESKYDGTLLYASPQQLKGAHTAKSDDVWSLGVIFHILLTGQFPFSTSEDAIFKLMSERGVLQKDLEGHLEGLSCSIEAADLLHQLLTWDASGRISLEAALEHPFLAVAGTPPSLSAQDVILRLDHFVDSCRLKQLAQTAIAHLLGESRKDGALARATFVELERLGDGEVTITSLRHFLQMHGMQPAAGWFSKVERLLGENGCIGYTRFLAAALDDSGIQGDQRVKSMVFDLLDSDGDGLISVEDLRSGLNLSLDDSTQVISEALADLGLSGQQDASSGITFWDFLQLLQPMSTARIASETWRLTDGTAHKDVMSTLASWLWPGLVSC